MRADARFHYLEDALTTHEHQRTDFQRRVVSALRMFDQAVFADNDQVRTILLATATEAMYGGTREGAHSVRQRSVVLTCGQPEAPHGTGRTACPFITIADPKDLPDAVAKGAWVCSNYDALELLFKHRNDALHEARQAFPPKNRWGGTHTRYVQESLLALLAWLAASGATKLGDLDRERKRIIAVSPAA
jgi:hypothetical protein